MNFLPFFLLSFYIFFRFKGVRSQLITSFSFKFMKFRKKSCNLEVSTIIIEFFITFQIFKIIYFSIWLNEDIVAEICLPLQISPPEISLDDIFTAISFVAEDFATGNFTVENFATGNFDTRNFTARPFSHGNFRRIKFHYMANSPR